MAPRDLEESLGRTPTPQQEPETWGFGPNNCLLTCTQHFLPEDAHHPGRGAGGGAKDVGKTVAQQRAERGCAQH